MISYLYDKENILYDYARKSGRFTEQDIPYLANTNSGIVTILSIEKLIKNYEEQTKIKLYKKQDLSIVMFSLFHMMKIREDLRGLSIYHRQKEGDLSIRRNGETIPLRRNTAIQRLDNHFKKQIGYAKNTDAIIATATVLVPLSNSVYNEKWLMDSSNDKERVMPMLDLISHGFTADRAKKAISIFQYFNMLEVFEGQQKKQPNHNAKMTAIRLKPSKEWKLDKVAESIEDGLYLFKIFNDYDIKGNFNNMEDEVEKSRRKTSVIKVPSIKMENIKEVYETKAPREYRKFVSDINIHQRKTGGDKYLDTLSMRQVFKCKEEVSETDKEIINDSVNHSGGRFYSYLQRVPKEYRNRLFDKFNYIECDLNSSIVNVNHIFAHGFPLNYDPYQTAVDYMIDDERTLFIPVSSGRNHNIKNTKKLYRNAMKTPTVMAFSIHTKKEWLKKVRIPEMIIGRRKEIVEPITDLVRSNQLFDYLEGQKNIFDYMKNYNKSISINEGLERRLIYHAINRQQSNKIRTLQMYLNKPNQAGSVWIKAKNLLNNEFYKIYKAYALKTFLLMQKQYKKNFKPFAEKQGLDVKTLSFVFTGKCCVRDSISNSLKPMNSVCYRDKSLEYQKVESQALAETFKKVIYLDPDSPLYAIHDAIYVKKDIANEVNKFFNNAINKIAMDFRKYYKNRLKKNSGRTSIEERTHHKKLLINSNPFSKNGVLLFNTINIVWVKKLINAKANTTTYNPPKKDRRFKKIVLKELNLKRYLKKIEFKKYDLKDIVGEERLLYKNGESGNIVLGIGKIAKTQYPKSRGRPPDVGNWQVEKAVLNGYF